MKITIAIDDIRPNLRLINLYQCDPGFNSGFRRLYNYYFLYVHKGKGIINIDDKEYNAFPGDLYFCSPGVPNSIKADITDPFLLSGIDFDFTLNHRQKKFQYPINAEAFNSFNVAEEIEFSDFGGFSSKITLFDDNKIRELMFDMIHQFNTQERFWENYVNALLHTFIIRLIRYETRNEIGVKQYNEVEELISYISKNYMNDLTNTKLAQLFHYNPEYLSRSIYLYTGITLKQYIINLRIRHALDLLLNSNTQIKDIATRVGYSNIHYFTRIFKMKTGFSPGHFRISFSTEK